MVLNWFLVVQSMCVFGLCGVDFWICVIVISIVGMLFCCMWCNVFSYVFMMFFCCVLLGQCGCVYGIDCIEDGFVGGWCVQWWIDVMCVY